MPVTLANDHLQVTVSPQLGASLMGLRARLPRGWTALMPEPGSAGCDLAAASFVMAPYSNRISGGRFTFGGRGYALEDGQRHAMHGCVRKRPWQVLDVGPTRVRLRFRSSDHAAVNWPWPFEVEVSYALDGPTLTSSFVLTNRGDSPMPAGFGFHPYFLRAPSREGEAVSVQFKTAAVYPDAHGTRIPSGPAAPVPACDYTIERALLPADFHDFCAAGYDGGGSITWPETGARIDFRATQAFGHLVFYNPPEPYFAMEPVTNANDGVNLLARGDLTSGIVGLDGSEALCGAFGMEVVPLLSGGRAEP
ncbi:MAG: hypothetical protein EXR69_02155 [Myxococcales bacterium]|nr:hypothetical protein [Myxococcales bacterium]